MTKQRVKVSELQVGDRVWEGALGYKTVTSVGVGDLTTEFITEDALRVICTNEKVLEVERNVPTRPSWDDYFLQMAQLVATRSTCIAQQVGAVVVRDRRVIATGYNGVPSGEPHCTDQGFCRPGIAKCTDNQDVPSRAIHAEANAIAQAAKFGIATAGATIYVTHQPCSSCEKAILAAGIKKTVVLRKEQCGIG